MHEFARLNADGKVDTNLKDFTPEELDRALDMRARVPFRTREGRRVQCPHTELCRSLDDCIAAIAWYMRHASELYRREVQG